MDANHPLDQLGYTATTGIPMLTDIRHKVVVLLACVPLALVAACGGSQPLPDIDATGRQTFFEPYGIMTAEAKLAAMPSHIDATVEAKLKEALAAIPPDL